MLNTEAKRYFRDQFREARYKALKDAEDFQSLFHALEMLGAYLTRDSDEFGLGRYKGVLEEIGINSPLHTFLPEEYPEYHNSFDYLYEYVRSGIATKKWTVSYPRSCSQFLLLG